MEDGTFTLSIRYESDTLQDLKELQKDLKKAHDAARQLRDQVGYLELELKSIIGKLEDENAD